VYGLLDALEGKVMANVCANAQNVLALSRRAQDGADLLLLENLNYDPEEEVLIRRADKPASVEEMSPDGTWKPLQFAFGAGVVSIPCPWPCYGVKVFRIR
jgi:hypothetical protein